jgi:hypothetical protein
VYRDHHERVLSPVPELPDEIFSNQKSQCGYLYVFWRALELKMLVYFMATWNISWPFDIFYGRLVHFPPLEYVLTRKVGQPEQKIPGLNPARV